MSRFRVRDSARRRLLVALLPAFLAVAVSAQNWSNASCQKCHGDKKIVTMPESYRRSMVVVPPGGADGGRTGKAVHPLFLDPATTLRGAHKGLKCVDCHTGMERIPHARQLPPVGCGNCHEEVKKKFAGSLHGMAVHRNDPLAPRCHTCHGHHNILPARAEASNTFKMNIPGLCGKCHREGTKVQEIREIPKHNILENYTQSIHGEGLFKKGLLTTAVCTDCHTTHGVLAHTDPESSIHAANIPATCMRCHAQIEKVHRKVIAGELWEKSPRAIPVCVECHQPHRARKVFYNQGMSDADCLSCHAKEILVQRDGKPHSLKVHQAVLEDSAHADVACVKCHTGVTPFLKRPCKTIKGAVDCSICHAEAVDKFKASVHGRLHAEGDEDAPDCLFCHGTHGIKGPDRTESLTYPGNIPDLCGRCHRDGEKAATRYKGPATGIIRHYKMSIHGKGLLESGLMVTATCVSCHETHSMLPAADPKSSVHRGRIQETCGRCHAGIYKQMRSSVHSELVTRTDKPLPICVDCHSTHSISRADKDDFRLNILDQCGGCHEKLTETYFQTYHGKVSMLGSSRSAKCQDCHGAHHILPSTHADSTLHPDRAPETCAKCHPGAHSGFTGYLTHATHHDRENHPLLFYAFWGMTLLLVGTLIVATLHTLAWLPASLRLKRQHTHAAPAAGEEGGLEYRRFPSIVSRTHFVVIISFFGLAITGMALKFSDTQWAYVISSLFGGTESMGLIHRFCALLTFGYAAVHLWWLTRLKKRSGLSWRGFIFHENSLMFNWRDLREVWQTIKWFAGAGPRPHYGRWTYWEKFDYFAVFWGIAIIGSSGLMLWFPVFFTRFLPGELLNVATIIHSDEALLAVGFIFTIHFFNTHFRPDKFPMDTVMFTGQMSLEELRRDKPREYEEWVAAGRPRDRLVPPLPAWYMRWNRIFGFAAVVIGLTLVALIFYGLIRWIL